MSRSRLRCAAYLNVLCLASIVGALEPTNSIEIRADYQAPRFYAAVAKSPEVATTLPSHDVGLALKTTRDDVEVIDRDEFLGQVEENLSISGFSERIDPFSGLLHIKMVDLVLPGNGGLDIVVQRYYNSQVWNRVDDPDPAIARHTPSVDLNGHLGESGWQLHMGKIINFFAEAGQDMWLIMPDGSRHTLYSRNGDPDDRITTEGWLYSRNGSIFTIRTTTGLKYIFDRDEPGADSGYLAMRDQYNRMHMIQCTKIEDLNGNSIVIEYSDFNYPGLGYGWGNRIERISFDDPNDDREIVFTYHVDSGGNPTNIIEHMKLKSDGTTIETWTFNYVGFYQVFHPQFPYVDWVYVNELGYVDHSITGDYVNESITNPWQFTYYGDNTALTEGKRLIKEVVSPRIGKLTYTWGAEVMETGGESCGGVQFLALQTRQSAVGIEQLPGGQIIYEDKTTTDYTYTNPGLEDASTTIVTTDSQTGIVMTTEDHVFHGWTLPYVTFDPNMWKIGRPKSRTTVIKDDEGEDLETTTTQTVWEQGTQYSNASRWSSLWVGCGNSRTSAPQSYVKPTTVTTVVERHDSIPDPPPVPPPDPATYTTVNSGFDDWGNVGLVSESSGDGLTRTTQFTYWQDATNNIMVGRVQGRNANPGGTQCFQYDTLGRVEHTYTNPQNDGVATCIATGTIIGARQVDYAYYATGNLYTQTEVSTPNNRVTTYTNYLYGKPKETTIDTGTATDIHYCRDYRPRGMLAWETDGRGCSTDYQTGYDYDFLGRRTLADPPLADPINYLYEDELGQPIYDLHTAFVVRDDRRLEYQFDRIGNGNLIAIYKHIGASPTTTQLFAVTNDALGRRRQIQQQWNARLGDLFSYDPLGRLTTITHPGTPTTMATIDHAGSTVTVTDEKLHTTTYEYKAFGDPNDRRLHSLSDANSFVTTYSYDSVFGNLEAVEAPISQGDRSFTYYSGTDDCNNGFLSSETHPESGTTSYQYDCLGGVTSRTRPGPESTTYGYDHAGRLTDINYPGTASDVDIGYDEASRRTSLSNDHANMTMDYDDAGRLETVTQSIVGGPQGLVTSYTYDSLDRPETITYPSSRVVKYWWNDDDWLERVTGPDGAGVEYISDTTYHLTGAVDLVTFANTVTMDHGIDDRNRLSGIVTTAPGGQLLNVTLVYDDVSNLETWDDHLPANLDRTFGYDNLDRLTTAGAPNLWGILGFTYDELGNRLTKTLNGATTTYEYDLSTNRLETLTGAANSTYSYDAVGRLVGETKVLPEQIFADGFESGDTSAWGSTTLDGERLVSHDWVYTFNAADQLTHVSRDTSIQGDYVYDGDNLRVSKTFRDTATYYFRNPQGNTLAEYNQDSELVAEYIYANGRQVAKVVPDGRGGEDFRFFHADHLGTALSITDEIGTPVWIGEYFPFGDAYSSDGEENRYRFTQHELDTMTGFLYAKARYYHPGIGRFISTDPAGGNVEASQSWNRYAYALGNPVKYTDPTGKAPPGALTEQAIRRDLTSSQVEQLNQIQNEVESVAAGPMLFFTPGPDELLVVAVLKPIGRLAGRLTARFLSKGDEVVEAVVRGGPYGHLDDHSSVSSGKPFTQSQKQKILAENQGRNSGQILDDVTGEPLVRAQQHTRGVTPPGNEAHVDHVYPRSQGGPNSFANAEVRSRTANLLKGDKIE